MPERQSMRRIRECYRLYFDNKMSKHQVAKALSIGRTTVWDHIQRLTSAGLSWDDVRNLSDEELEQKLFSKPAVEPTRPLPDWATVHQELSKHRFVTMQILWEEYIKTHPDGYSYPQYCRYYRKWAARLNVYMRQPHAAGERLYVDYSGKKLYLTNLQSGEIRAVELFVMAWGASHYLYAEAQESQCIQSWVMGHVRAFEYFGCVPHLVVPDNLKSAVTKSHLYDPDINRSYTDLAQHYGFGVLPARPGKPKDKPKVENGVLIIQRWIVAALRHRIFYTMSSLNAAIRELLDKANSKLLQRIRRSRLDLFTTLDKPQALALPQQSYQFHDWIKATVGFDYHVSVEQHYYSVPWELYGKQLDIRVSERTVEIFQKQQRVALHHRNKTAFGYTTNSQHMPKAHQKFLDWTPSRLLFWAKKIGPNTLELINHILSTKTHPQQGFRPAMGVLRLGKAYGDDRLEVASGIALRMKFDRVSEITSLLKNGLDRKQPEKTPGSVVNTTQSRGASYYTGTMGNEERTGS